MVSLDRSSYSLSTESVLSLRVFWTGLQAALTKQGNPHIRHPSIFQVSLYLLNYNVYNLFPCLGVIVCSIIFINKLPLLTFMVSSIFADTAQISLLSCIFVLLFMGVFPKYLWSSRRRLACVVGQRWGYQRSLVLRPTARTAVRREHNLRVLNRWAVDLGGNYRLDVSMVYGRCICCSIRIICKFAYSVYLVLHFTFGQLGFPIITQMSYFIQERYLWFTWIDLLMGVMLHGCRRLIDDLYFSSLTQSR